MKKLYAALYGIILTCMIGTALLLAFMPNTIPAHYNSAGEVDRFGSKYENLIWPLLAAIMGVFFVTPAKLLHKKGAITIEKILLFTGICTLLFFTGESFYFMVKAILQ